MVVPHVPVSHPARAEQTMMESGFDGGKEQPGYSAGAAVCRAAVVQV